MRSALTTAAGVAGGMLLADSLRNMLGGHAQAKPAPAAAADESSGDKQEPQYVDEKDNDPGNSDAGDNDPGFDSGGDIEI